MNDINILETIEKIAREVEMERHRANFIGKIASTGEFNILDEFLHIVVTGEQESVRAWAAVLFAQLFHFISQGRRVTLERLITNLSTGPMDLAVAIRSIESLVILGLAETSRWNDEEQFLSTSINIPAQVLALLTHGEELPVPDMNEVFFKRMRMRLMNMKQGKVTDIGLYQKEIKELFRKYSNSILEQINGIERITSSECIILILVVMYHIAEKRPTMLLDDLSPYISTEEFFTIIPNIEGFFQNMIQNQWITMEDSFDRSDFVISLTKEAVERFGFQQETTKTLQRPGGGDGLLIDLDDAKNTNFTIIGNNDIKVPRLFFNEENKRELEIYRKLLLRSDSALCKALPYGKKLVLMFEGDPGTGKTIAAKWLARESGRDLAIVNWQTFRNQFVGESEKSLKRILDHIDRISNGVKKAPVVLLNEAEALLSQRVPITHSTDRMENNIIALLLEWLEKDDKFEIIIFTSNYREIMDKAYERRIIHLGFDLPDEPRRRKIWQTLSAEYGIKLSSQITVKLATYKLTGAEISNALRKYRLFQVANEIRDVDLLQLESICRSQKWLDTRQRIGF